MMKYAWIGATMLVACPQTQMNPPAPSSTVTRAIDWDTPTALGPTVRELVAALDLPAQVTVAWSPGAPDIMPTSWTQEVSFDATSPVMWKQTTYLNTMQLCRDDDCQEYVEATHVSDVYDMPVVCTWTDPETGWTLTGPAIASITRDSVLPIPATHAPVLSDLFQVSTGTNLSFPDGTTYVPANWSPPAGWVPLALPAAIEQGLESVIAPTARLDTLGWFIGTLYALDSTGAVQMEPSSIFAFSLVNTEPDPGDGTRSSPFDDLAVGALSASP